MEPAKILIVDDDQAVCMSIKLALKRSGMKGLAVHHPKNVFRILEEESPNLVLLDMNFTIDTSGKQGLKLLKQLQDNHPHIPVILMTGWATVELAVKGMKIGAKDFIAKPWDNKQLITSIKTILQLVSSGKEEEFEKAFINFSPIIGEDPAFQKMLSLAKRISQTDASVLIEGESGTGKELIAESIHYESHRSSQPFVKVNLGGIASTLFESEMFGHRKGAFTDAIADRKGRFSMADKGTIFLDEIGDLPMESQVKLLRVLQEKTFEVLGSSKTQKVDVRIISATNKKLVQMVENQLFREDLFYRINLIHLTIPPLRERRNDIPLLVHRFIENLKQNYHKPDLSVSKEALDWLKKQHFPGNIRQLKNLVERTVLVSVKDKLELDDFEFNQNQLSGNRQEGIKIPAVGTLSLEEMEVKMIKQALKYHNNKVSEAARSLGITRSALYRRLSKYNIPYDA